MSNYELNGSSGYVALDGPVDTLAVVNVDHITTNQTRTTAFNPKLLMEWAEAVEDAYGSEAHIVFTPGKPILATASGKDDSVGIGLAPRIKNSGVGDDDD